MRGSFFCIIGVIDLLAKLVFTDLLGASSTLATVALSLCFDVAVVCIQRLR